MDLRKYDIDDHDKKENIYIYQALPQVQGFETGCSGIHNQPWISSMISEKF